MICLICNKKLKTQGQAVLHNYGDHTTDELEVEPFPDDEIIVGRGGIIDAVEWKGALFRTRR